MNILLIGATGKIGKNLLTHKLSTQFDNVFALVRSDKNVKLVESVGMTAIKNN
jgi:putative NADH-flavin reductase